MKIKENLPLLLGVGIPMVIILGLIVMTMILPALFVDPKHNFVYADVSRDYSRPVIVVDTEGNTIPQKETEKETKQFYVYDVVTGGNTPITQEELEGLSIHTSDVSPDGYKFVSGDGSGDVFIFPIFYDGGSGGGYAIEKGNWLRKPVELRSNSYYSYQIQFVGWIVD